MTEPTVLLIDADPAVRDSLTTLMDLNGFKVQAFSTGSAFLRELDQSNIHCVICEAELPDITGVQVYHRLQAQHESLPFALLISQRDINTLRSAQSAGITQIFQKPLVHRHLLTFVSRC
jgi:two-component system response regulator TtrR